MAAARISKKLAPEALWEYALNALGVRAHSAAELKRKLLRRAQSPSDVDSVMAKLREYGMADDRKFSEAFAVSRRTNSGLGQFRILRELRARQVAPAVAERAVAEAFAGTDEQQLAEDFLLRRYRAKNLAIFLKEEKNLAAAYRRLRTGGFSPAASLAVLKKYNRQAEECGELENEEPEA
jgi:regulatory protein